MMVWPGETTRPFWGAEMFGMGGVLPTVIRTESEDVRPAPSVTVRVAMKVAVSVAV